MKKLLIDISPNKTEEKIARLSIIGHSTLWIKNIFKLMIVELNCSLTDIKIMNYLLLGPGVMVGDEIML